MSVENFDYNGFFVNGLPGFAPYLVVKFLRWTSDPGIILALCSDGKKRLIPTCCLSYDFIETLPPDPNKKNHLFFGVASKS